LLPLLELNRDVTRNLTNRLRKVTKQLGAVREADVLMLLIQELSQDNRYAPLALKQIGGTAAQAGAAARERLSTKLPTAKLKRLARKLERVSKRLESDDAETDRHGASSPKGVWLRALEARLARRAFRVREAVEAAGAVYMPQRLHDVRIAVKKLRYAAELADETTGKRIAGDIAALKAAQDLLGRLHDLEVLLVQAREGQASLARPDLTAWRDLRSLVHVVEDDCRRLHARYMRDRTNLTVMANRMGPGARAAQLVGRRTAS
jgi:CHAD domain-containing protein